jgi:ClpP class serine protease
MDFFALLWLFFIISSLQPVVQQRWLESQRMRAFARLEKKRKSRVIGLIHRQESLKLLGIPIARYIDIQDSEELLRAIQLTDRTVPIDLILHTPGGLLLAAEQIAMALSAHDAKVTVLVPHYAMSGGTLIALAADEIVMGQHAVLGPVDPQLGQYPAASILKVIERKPIAEIDDQTIILGDVAQKAICQVEQFVHDLLSARMPGERSGDVARTLSTGTWTHDFPITVRQAREFGLTVSTDMPEEVFELMHLYPQTAQQRPSVEYLPLPYGPREAPARDTKSERSS